MSEHIVEDEDILGGNSRLKSEHIVKDEFILGGNSSRLNYSRPSLAQVKAVVGIMEKHPEFANRKHKLGTGQSKYKKFWVELANVVNAYEGSVKSSKGWLKVWSDKKRVTLSKYKQIQEGKSKSSLTSLEHKILNLCEVKTHTPKKKKNVKQELCNGKEAEESEDNVFIKGEDGSDDSRLASTETEERQFDMLEKMVHVMDQQASALSQLAQASLANSKAMEKIAEASHMQALAVDRLVGSFETIGATTADIKNAILGIDFTLKRCYPANPRQNSTLFT